MPRGKRWADTTYQKLPLEVLSVEALNRVSDMRSEYDLALKAYQGRIAQNELEMKSIESALSSADKQQDDVQNEIAQLYAQLAPFQVGVIGKWLLFEPTLTIGSGLGAAHYRLEAQALITKLNDAYKRWQPGTPKSSLLRQQLRDLETKPHFAPKREARLRYQSQTFVFDIGAIDTEQLVRIIAKKENKAALEQTEERNKRERVQAALGQTKAKAAAYENKQRELAKTVRAALQRQLKDNPCCPYCNVELSSKEPHADHIHPVVKGGLSTIRNMVFVCESCNVQKGTLTLRAFLKKMNYVEAEVYERLERIGKDV